MIARGTRSPLDPLILIVEDDDQLRKASARILAAAGFPVIEAANAEDGIRRLEEHPTTAVLFTDIVLPGMNGFALAGQALRRWPGLRVMFTTTSDKLRDVDNQPGLLPGLILLKPYERRDLEAAIDKTLMRAAPAIPEYGEM
jgi:DNA-binding response OmpR family regulator